MSKSHVPRFTSERQNIGEIDPRAYLFTNHKGRPIIIADVTGCEFTPHQVTEVVAAPNPRNAPIFRLHIPERRWKKHRNTLPPCGKVELPWRSSLYTTRISELLAPTATTTHYQAHDPFVIFGHIHLHQNFPEFHYHHTPHKSPDALVKIPWYDRNFTPNQTITPDQASFPPFPVCNITRVYLPEHFQARHNVIMGWRISSTSTPYGVDYWIIKLKNSPLQNWPYSFTEITPADRS